MVIRNLVQTNVCAGKMTKKKSCLDHFMFCFLFFFFHNVLFFFFSYLVSKNFFFHREKNKKLTKVSRSFSTVQSRIFSVR